MQPDGLGFQAVWFLSVFVVVIPLHELGHAIAGILVGHKIKAIIIGAGPRLLSFTVAGAAVQINVLPLGGVTMGFPRPGAGWPRLRQWIFAAGGPAANLAVYFVLTRLLGAHHDGTARTFSFWSVAAMANWAVMVMNLVPFRTAEGALSDGYALLTIPFWGPRQMETLRAAAEGRALLDAMNRNDLDGASRIADELAARYPGNPLADMLIGTVLHHQNRHEEARVVWRRALANETEAARVPMHRNNLAFVDVVIGDSEGLREADLLSEAAIAARPEHPAIMGTRGAALVRLGRAAEALPLLVRSTAAAQTPHSRAYNGASLASALAMLGRVDEARAALETARRADPACSLLAQAEADLAAAVPSGAAPAAAGAVVRQGRVARVLAGWGGVARWQQIARGVAFAVMVLPLHAVSTEMLAVDLAAIAIFLSPEPVALTVFGACTVWGSVIHALHLDAAATSGASGWAATLLVVLGLAALALAAVRDRLGPRLPSKVPLVLSWLLGFTALPAVMPVVRRLFIGHGASVLHSLRASTIAPTVAETVSLLGLAVVLLAGQRRWVKALALIPVVLIVAAGAGTGRSLALRAALEKIPAGGPPVAWGAHQAATVLRSRQFSTHGYTAALSPGGRAFFTTEDEDDKDGRLRTMFRASDFDGHVVAVEGVQGIFLDDQRLAVLRNSHDAAQLFVVDVTVGVDSIRTRTLPDLAADDIQMQVEPGGRSILLVGSSRIDDDKQMAVRVPTEGDGAVEWLPVGRGVADRDERLRFFVAPENQGGTLVLRSPHPVEESSEDEFEDDPPVEKKDDGASDLPLWLLTPNAEVLIAGHAPRLHCLLPAITRSSLWCVARADRRFLFEIDPRGRRMTRLNGEISRGQLQLVGPSKLALLSNGELGVLDLETGRGVWLTLPDSDDHAFPTLVKGGLGTLARSYRGKHATITVYALP
jgi:tetratricopeptide (TPR) repeat protein